MSFSIKSLQLRAVERMLRSVHNNHNTSSGSLQANGGSSTTTTSFSQQWKVLVYDGACRDIISPLITVRKLRENGVTLHMLISATRDRIPDVPAVYFLQPSEENVRRVVEDCKRKLYDEIYLNFCSPLSQPLMQMLARGMVEANAVSVVCKVFDQFLGFVSLEPQLFTVNMAQSFVRYNKPSLVDHQVEACMKEVAQGATSAIATLGILPIIRCPQGGPAEMVARLVCENLHALYADKKSGEIFSLGSSSLEQRPIMLILDRSVDMAATLYHTSGYQTLVDDLLEFRLNRVTIQSAEEGQKPVSKVYSLNSETDQFWSTYAAKMIPEAVEAHSTDLLQVSNQVEQIKMETGGGDLQGDGLGGADGSSNKTSSLLSTVQSLPALLEKKKALEVHLEIIKAAMSIISERHVYKFAEVEDSMIANRYGDRSKIAELLQDAEFMFEDKIRCLAVYLLVTNPSAQDVEQLVQIVEQQVGESETHKDLFKTIAYIKRMLSLTGFGAAEKSDNQKNSSSIWSFADRAAQSLIKAQQQVKGLVSGAKLLAATRMMDAVCKDATSPTVAAEVDAEFLYMDPKVQSGHVPTSSRIRTPFSRGVLFMVGGGCFAEFHNLCEYASGKLSASTKLSLATSSSSQPKRTFIYGCTELVNAKQFMSQISACYS